MPIIDQVADAMQDILITIAHHLARETQFVQRESKLDGATFVQTLVFTYLADPDATLDQLTQTAAALGVDITPPGLTQRFTPQAATFLQCVLAAALRRVLAADPLAIPVLEQFTGVFIEDSTIIVLPEELRELWRGCGNAREQGDAALKLTLRLDLLTGLLAGLSLHDGRRHESAAAHPITSLPADSLYLVDLGFFSLERLQQIVAQQAFFLSRLQAQTTVFTADGERWDDLAALVTQHDTGAVIDLPITLGVRHRLNARLIAVRVPQEVADQRRRRLRAEAARRGQTVSASRLALAAWTIFITNAPAARLAGAAVLVVARARWQIELLFKLWKSQGRIDESRSGKPWRVICDVYAKVLAMVVSQWTWLLSVWGYPDRSLTKAVQTVQKYALQLATGLWSQTRTRETLETIARTLAKGCRMNSRKKHPNTYQLLLAVTELP
jgi:Transposase DDE domain